MEKFGRSKEGGEAESRSVPVRRLVFAGLGAVTVATSALYHDERGDTYIDKGFDQLAQMNVADRVAQLSLDERLKYDAVSNILVQKVGVTKIGSIVNSEEDGRRREGEIFQEPEIIDFEQTGVITNEDVRKATSSDFFPQGWIQQVGSIVYINSSNEMLVTGMNKKGPGSERDTITFFKFTMPHSEDRESMRYRMIGLMLGTLRHEVCHSNDWGTKSNRSFVDRIELLSNIIAQVESKDAYDGHPVLSDNHTYVPYHLSYGYANRAERMTAYQEYFADICRAYLSHPELFKQEYPKDWGIVDTWIKKTDPNFDTRKISPGPISGSTGELNDEWKKLFN